MISDGDVVLGESAAIIEYLIQTYGGGNFTVAPGVPNYADYLFWYHFANGSLVPSAMIDMIATSFASKNELIGALRERLDRAYDQVEARLAKVPYLAGEAFTAADLISVFPFTTMRMFAPRDLAPYPSIRAWLRRIADRPAFQQAMAKADPGFVVPLE